MELEQKKAAEQQQANIELARKNEIADRQMQLDAAKFQCEQSTLPAIAQLQDALRAEKVKNAEMALQLKSLQVGHDVEKGAVQFENLELRHAVTTAAEQGQADHEELVQGNIEKARENQLKEEGHHLERSKIALEHKKLQVDAEEEKQKNIEMARSNELGHKQHELGVKKIGLDALQLDRTEMQSRRDHELAMNPPPEPAPKAQGKSEGKSAGEAGGDAQNVDTLANAIAEIQHVVSDLSEKVHGEGGHQAKPDHMPALIEALHKVASRPTPKGVKRTPSGMELVFDDMPKPPPPEPQQPSPMDHL